MLWNPRVTVHVHKNHPVNRSSAIWVQSTPFFEMCLRYILISSICASKLPISVWFSDSLFTFLMPCRVFWILSPFRLCQVSEAYELWRSSLCNFVHPSVNSRLLDPFSSDLSSQSPSNCVFLVITKPSSTTIKNIMRKYNFGSETVRSEMHVGERLWIHSARNFGVLPKICWTNCCMLLIYCREKCAVNL